MIFFKGRKPIIATTTTTTTIAPTTTTTTTIVPTTTTTTTIPPTTTTTTTLAPVSAVASTIIDDGYYNAFSVPEYYEGTIYAPYKKAGSHAAAGPFTMAKSSNGGTTWTESQIQVNGTNVVTAAVSFGILANGRQLIAYQDNEAYTAIKFAYRDGTSGTFTAGTVFNFDTAFVSSISPVKFFVMPSGKIYSPYYSSSISGTPYHVGLLQSTDGGESFQQGPIIFTHNGSTYGDWWGNEVSIVITENTGVDATCKMIAAIRTHLGGELAQYGMHYKSSDGGVTWTTDFTEDAGSFVNDAGATVNGPFARHLIYSFMASPAPYYLFAHGGLIYNIMGERNDSVGYRIKYSTATPAGAFRNRWDDWIRPISTTENLYATTNGSKTDVGYPVPFVDGAGNLWMHFYDVSTQAVDLQITTRRVLIKQAKIEPIPVTTTTTTAAPVSTYVANDYAAPDYVV